MEAKESKILDILSENNRYSIPAYQRPYSWDKDNVEQLVEDIYNSFKQEDIEYFIGSMICIENEKDEYEVVDGQQRLTTLSIILARLKDAITDNELVKNKLQDLVMPLDPFSDEPPVPRLQVRKKESLLYEKYILQSEEAYFPDKPTYSENLFIENSKVIGGFFKSISQAELCQLAKYILNNVFVVFVKTGDLASSFRLFNVLNNRGLPLSNSDLLKNSLFEVASQGNSDPERVEAAWLRIEENIGVDNFDRFLTLHKLSQKNDRDRVLQKNLDSFMDALRGTYKNDAIEYVNSLEMSANNYQRIKDNDFTDSGLSRRIGSLLNLGTDEWLPPILSFLNRKKLGGEFTEQQFIDFVTTFEKVYMHGWLMKQPKSKREMVCYSALVAINNVHSFDEILEFVIAHADNDGVLVALEHGIYEPTPNKVNLVKTVLLRIDQEIQDDSVIKTYSGRITIEHVLPQRPTNEYWLSRFTEEEHAVWVHKLGNLTLVSGSKNSEAQNSDFNKKKSVYEKQNNRVSFDVTKEVCQLDNWGMSELTNRHAKLVNLLKSIWLVNEQIRDFDDNLSVQTSLEEFA